MFLLYRGDNIQVERYWVMVVFGAHWPGDPDFWRPTVKRVINIIEVPKEYS